MSRHTDLRPTESSPTGSLLFFLLGSLVLKPSGNQSWPCSRRRFREATIPTATKANSASPARTTYTGYSSKGGSSILPETRRRVDMSEPQKCGTALQVRFLTRSWRANRLVSTRRWADDRCAFEVIRIANRSSSKRMSWQIRNEWGKKRGNWTPPLPFLSPGDNFTTSSLRGKKERD